MVTTWTNNWTFSCSASTTSWEDLRDTKTELKREIRDREEGQSQVFGVG